MKKFFEKMKFQKKSVTVIYSLVTLSGVALLSLGLWTTFFNINNTLFEIEVDNAKKSLQRVFDTTEFIAKTSLETAYSLFENSNAKILMYSTEEIGHSQVAAVNNLREQIGLTNPNIHSMYIYNPIKKEYYSTLGGMYTIDQNFLQNIQAIRVSETPVYRKIGAESVVTFMWEDWSNAPDAELPAVFVNFKAKQYFNIIEHFSTIDFESESNFFVLDENNNVINIVDENNGIGNYIVQTEKSASSDKIELRDGVYIFRNADFLDKKYTITLVNVPILNWKLVEFYPNSILYKYRNETFAIFLIINIITVVVLTITFSPILKRLLRPITELANNIVESHSQFEGLSSEFDILREFYIYSNEQMMKTTDDNLLKSTITKEYVLKNLLFSSNIFTQSDLDEMNLKNNLNIDLKKEVRIIVAKIDDFSKLAGEIEVVRDEGVVLRAIANIFTSLFRDSYKVDSFVTTRKQIVLLYQSNTMSLENEKEHIARAREILASSFNLTATFSHLTKEISVEAIQSSFLNLEEGLYDRFMKGDNADILDFTNTMTTIDYSTIDDTAFISKIRVCDIEGSKKELEKLLNKIRDLPYQNAIVAVTHLTSEFQSSLLHINEKRETPIKVNEVIARLIDLKNMTLDRYERIIVDFLETTLQSDQKEIGKYDLLGKSIKQCIDTEYSDCNLGAVSIGEELGITPSYVGKVFREYEGTSIPEYINQVRMHYVMEWMINSHLTLVEIMEKVGYQNESNFYKVFREKFGMTPREYLKTKRR